VLKEVIVVEGKSDTAAIRRALEADTIETGGFTLAASTLRKIEAAYKKRGIIILTDPDGAGNRIYHSRVIDIDILFYGSEHISAPDLIIPHKDIENRPFVMIPLQEVAKPSLKSAFPEYFGTE